MAEPAEQTPPVAAEVEEPTKAVEEKEPELDVMEIENKAITGLSTPAEVNTPAESVDLNPLSRKVTLADLCAKGTAFYTRRQYEAAADTFSKASILQVELNGETSPENAEILFHYGRSLFKVGQSKSDVLGGPAAAANKNKKPKGGEKTKKAPAPEVATTEEEKVTQEGIAIIAEKKEAEHKAEGDKAEGDKTDAKNPLFQFTGDENFDESDEEEVSWRWYRSGDCARNANAVSRALKVKRKKRKRTMTWPLLLRFSISHACATSSDWSN